MTLNLSDQNTVGVFANHRDAEDAVLMLANANIGMHDISVVGCDDHASEASYGNYVPPDFIKKGLELQGERDGIWVGGLFGLLAGFGSIFLPGIGLLVVLGPLAGLIGGIAVGAIGGDLSGQLTFTDIAADYRRWLVDGKYLVIVHCTSTEEPRVRKMMETMQSLAVNSHPTVLLAEPVTS